MNGDRLEFIVDADTEEGAAIGEEYEIYDEIFTGKNKKYFKKRVSYIRRHAETEKHRRGSRGVRNI